MKKGEDVLFIKVVFLLFFNSGKNELFLVENTVPS